MEIGKAENERQGEEVALLRPEGLEDVDDKKWLVQLLKNDELMVTEALGAQPRVLEFLDVVAREFRCHCE